MADTVTFLQNGYNGEVLEDLLTYTAQGNDTFREGLIHIKSGIQHKYTLPAIKLGDIIQDNVPTPLSSHGAKGPNGENEYQFTERYLIPQDFMVYLEFNPRDFESYWKFAQPDGNLVFRELDPKLQATMLRLLMDKKNEFLGNAIWTSARGGAAAAGITVPANSTPIGAGKEKYFDGVIKRMLDNVTATDAETIAGGQCVVSGTTELDSGAAIEAALYSMWMKTPKQIRKKSGLTFIMDWGTWDLYDQYLTDKMVKYSENSEINRYRFKGKRIIPIVGCPEHTIVLGNFTTGMDSNLWMGVDYANDTEVLKVDRLQSNSELFFFQMRMKMDVNIVKPAEIVVHTAYTKP
ncbi:hypothetical protein [Alistipes indistinctus]|uniref:hypothetical protein n=1 Tax=Alistipes indistinctus TaxID=626932 RepID=UPI00205A379E|nr:MAG TPA: major capsid protein [Caudoviricetes sp.]